MFADAGGVAAFLSYTAAVVFSPLAYPGYDWMAQAVSDLSASNARVGIYLFTIMEWVSAVGFGMFPLSDSGYAGTFQDKMHIFSTVMVVLLSIVSLVLIIIAGAKDKSCRSYGIFAAIALGMMMVGAMGVNIVPKNYFGIIERFSVFAATGYNAVLGIELYRMKF